MATKKELIQFTLQNSSDCDFTIELFQQNVFSVNATTKYSWNITTQDLSCGTGTIVINGTTYNLTYAASVAGLVAALNALGFGFFCSETIEGETFIYTVDDTNVYGDLTLCDQGNTTTTTTTTSTTVAPVVTTTTTTTSTTEAPVSTTTTTTTTTEAPVTTTTTTTTTTEAPVTTTTTTTTTTVAFAEWQARYSILEGDVCAQTQQTVYTAAGALFTTGDTVYTDSALTTPLIGFNYISELISGTIYEIGNGTGVIGADTLNSC